MMYHTTKPVCWQDKQDNKIIVSVSVGSCRFVTDHIQQVSLYTINIYPRSKGTIRKDPLRRNHKNIRKMKKTFK